MCDGHHVRHAGQLRLGSRQTTGQLDHLFGLAQLFCIAGNRNHLDSVCGQVKCSLSAESSPGAGDHGYFAFQLEAHVAFFFGFFFGLAAAVSK